MQSKSEIANLKYGASAESTIPDAMGQDFVIGRAFNYKVARIATLIFSIRDGFEMSKLLRIIVV